MKLHLVVLSLYLIFSTNSNASHITINSGDFGGGQWDTLVSVSLGPNSKNTALEDGAQVFESPITGTLSIYLNEFYVNTPATVGIDFSLTDASFSTADLLVLVLNDNPNSTSLLSHHSLNNFEQGFCFDYPDNEFCTNFDPGNSSIGGNGFHIGTVEAGLDIELDLGFISFDNIGNGSTLTTISGNLIGGPGGSVPTEENISLFISGADDFDNAGTYIFDSNPVPLPASIWFFMSGCVALFSLRKRKTT